MSPVSSEDCGRATDREEPAEDFAPVFEAVTTHVRTLAWGLAGALIFAAATLLAIGWVVMEVFL